MSSLNAVENPQGANGIASGNGGNVIGSLVPRANFNVGALTSRVIYPPSDWVGPVPSTACELFIRRIPRNIDMALLVEPFQRFGKIYEMRVPLDYNMVSRGYAYIKYTEETAAECALNVMAHYHIVPSHRLEVLHSYEKSRLFIANIPTHLPEQEVFLKLTETFPNVERVFSRCTGNNPLDVSREQAQLQLDQRPTEARRNQGHAFVQFPTHRMAIEAKRLRCQNGTLTLFGRDLRVVWANSQPEANMCSTTKTLFVRNVDNGASDYELLELIQKCVPRNVLRKWNRIPNIAFLEFVTRDAATNCLKQLQGSCLRGKRLEVEWARLSQNQTLHKMRNTDFDALLRIKCIANGWQIPIIVFGAYFEDAAVQYTVVILRGPNGFSRAIFCIFPVTELRDIHSRLCEVICTLIDIIATFPDYNYVFYVEKETAHLLGVVSHTIDSVNFLGANRVPQRFTLDLHEIFDLSYGVASLVNITEDHLLNVYNETFLSRNVFTYLPWCTLGGRIFGTIMPKYRNKRALPYHLNDTQIVLAMCFCGSGTNTTTRVRPHTPVAASLFDQANNSVEYMKMTLMALSLSQSSAAVSHLLPFVKYGGVQYYHPAQRFMVPPVWISGYSYSRSIYQLTASGVSMGPCGNAGRVDTNELSSNGPAALVDNQPNDGAAAQDEASGMQLPQNPSFSMVPWSDGTGGVLQPPLLPLPFHIAYGGSGREAGGMTSSMSSVGRSRHIPHNTHIPMTYFYGGLGGGDGMPPPQSILMNYSPATWSDGGSCTQPLNYAADGLPRDGAAGGMLMNGGAEGDGGVETTHPTPDNSVADAQPK